MTRAAMLIAVLGVFIAMTVIVAVRSLGDASPAQRGPGEQALPVSAYVVGEHTFADIVEALGTARANETVTVTARVRTRSPGWLLIPVRVSKLAISWSS